MAMLSNLDLIRRVRLFSMLTADQAQSVADSVSKRRYKRGEILVEQGTHAELLARGGLLAFCCRRAWRPGLWGRDSSQVASPVPAYCAKGRELCRV